MPINTLKSQKTNGGFGNLHINYWKEKREIKISTLYLISYNF